MRPATDVQLPTTLAVAVMVVFGAVVWLPVFGAASLGVASHNALWYFAAYPLMIAAAFLISRWHRGRPWLLAAAMVFASYVTALVFVPGTGNLLPFELVIMAVLTVLPALAAKWVAKYWDSSQHANVGG